MLICMDEKASDSLCGVTFVTSYISPSDYLGRDEEFPIYTYNRTGRVAAVIASTVYRGCRNPELNGLYFFSDYGLG